MILKKYLIIWLVITGVIITFITPVIQISFMIYYLLTLSILKNIKDIKGSITVKNFTYNILSICLILIIIFLLGVNMYNINSFMQFEKTVIYISLIFMLLDKES